jgi:hypothetical protein
MSYKKEIVKEAIRLYLNGKSEKDIANTLYLKGPKGSELGERTIRTWIGWYKLVIELIKEDPQYTKLISFSAKSDDHRKDMIEIANKLLAGGLEHESLTGDSGILIRELEDNLYKLTNSTNSLLINCFSKHIEYELSTGKPVNLSIAIRSNPIRLIKALRLISAKRDILGKCEICSHDF